MSLTGHLSTCPLPDLVEIIRYGRETGCLEIPYTKKSPALFYFKGGELADARIGDIVGAAAALDHALTLPNTSFRFRSHLDLTSFPVMNKPPLFSLATTRVTGLLTILPAKLGSVSVHPGVRHLMIVCGAGTLLLSLMTATVAVAGRFSRSAAAAAVASSAPTPAMLANQLRHRSPDVIAASATTADTSLTRSATDATTAQLGTERIEKRSFVSSRSTAKRNQLPAFSSVAVNSAATLASAEIKNKDAAQEPNGATSGHTVAIAQRIEDGRVIHAFVANSRPGMETYEASALRIARGRRYPAVTDGLQTVLITIDGPQR